MSPRPTQLPSPAKRRHELVSGHPASPLARKRLHTSPISALNLFYIPPSSAASSFHTFSITTDQLEVPHPSVSSISSSPTPSSQYASGMLSESASVFKTLRNKTNTHRQVIKAQFDERTPTAKLYERHVENFFGWLTENYPDLDCKVVVATTVAAFLEYESSRPKVMSKLSLVK